MPKSMTIANFPAMLERAIACAKESAQTHEATGNAEEAADAQDLHHQLQQFQAHLKGVQAGEHKLQQLCDLYMILPDKPKVERKKKARTSLPADEMPKSPSQGAAK